MQTPTFLVRRFAKEFLMRDYRDAKVMARALRAGLTDQSLTVTHSQSLELVAKAFGFDNWNILAAKIEAARPAAAEPAPEPAKGASVLYGSFCGKSQHDVKKLIAGPNSFICDDCVGLCADIIEHGDVLALLAEDERAGGEAAGYPKLAQYLAEQSSAHLNAYLAKMDRELSRMRDGLAGVEGAIEARAEGRAVDRVFTDRTDEQLERQRRVFGREIGGTEKTLAIITRALETRG
jgi:hypothetical protein